MRILTVGVLFALLAACTQSSPSADVPSTPVPSGPSSTMALTDMSGSDWEYVCEDWVADAVTIECEDVTIEPATVAECVSANSSVWTGPCTLEDWQACAAWDPVDPCDPQDPPAVCAALADCLE